MERADSHNRIRNGTHRAIPSGLQSDMHNETHDDMRNDIRNDIRISPLGRPAALGHPGASGHPPTRWDFVGITASSLCLVHCLAMPLVLLAFPVLGQVLPDEHHVHMLLGVLVGATGLAAFVAGYRQHRRTPLLAAAVVGVALILAGSFGHDTLPSPVWAEVLTVCGSLVLVAAHLVNLRLCRQCRHAH